LLLFLIAGCVQNTQRTEHRATSQMNASPVIQVGDTLSVSVADIVAPGVESQKTVRVGEDGTISLALIGKIDAAGSSPQELAERNWRTYDRSVCGSFDLTVTALTGPARTNAPGLWPLRRTAGFPTSRPGSGSS
jgi:protein involved in polysaccharide export with SLBB domain